MRRLNGILLTLILILLPSALLAQNETPQPLGETIEIGLSTDTITITSDFSGADLTIFGAVDNADPLLMRQGRYDIVVVLEGPSRNIVVRKKTRVLGIWINTQSTEFSNTPASYIMSMTKQPQDITDEKSYKQLALGADNIYLSPANEKEKRWIVEEFSGALRDRKKANGLYSERVGGVQYLSSSLFRATLELPASVPLGTHKARAFLFKNGQFIKETSAQLHIAKSGFEQAIYRTAHDYGFIYGILAVLLAVVTGWLGRIIFQRD